MQPVDVAQERGLSQPGAGTFGSNLAALFHLKDSEHAVTSAWAGTGFDFVRYHIPKHPKGVAAFIEKAAKASK